MQPGPCYDIPSISPDAVGVVTNALKPFELLFVHNRFFLLFADFLFRSIAGFP
jgi:hypothetical protein